MKKMCYAVYIPTDSTEELAACNSDLVRFERLQDPVISLNGPVFHVGPQSVRHLSRD